MSESSGFIQGKVGQLEAIWTGENEQPPDRIAILCHPHPQHEGTMCNKVVTTLHKAFDACGIATVRFNYRGVGESDGTYGHMQGEVEDLISVIDWVTQWAPEATIYVAGFSFGAYISYKVAADSCYRSRIQGLICVAPPVSYVEFKGLPEPGCPWAVVHGDEDELFDLEAVDAWVQSFEPVPKFIHMAKASHFFHRQLVLLRENLIDCIKLL